MSFFDLFAPPFPTKGTITFGPTTDPPITFSNIPKRWRPVIISDELTVPTGTDQIYITPAYNRLCIDSIFVYMSVTGLGVHAVSLDVFDRDNVLTVPWLYGNQLIYLSLNGNGGVTRERHFPSGCWLDENESIRATVTVPLTTDIYYVINGWEVPKSG